MAAKDSQKGFNKRSKNSKMTTSKNKSKRGNSKNDWIISILAVIGIFVFFALMSIVSIDQERISVH